MYILDISGKHSLSLSKAVGYVDFARLPLKGDDPIDKRSFWDKTRFLATDRGIIGGRGVWSNRRGRRESTEGAWLKLKGGVIRGSPGRKGKNSG